MSRPDDLAGILAALQPQADLAHRHLWLIHLLDWVRGQRDSVPGAVARFQLFLDAVQARRAGITVAACLPLSTPSSQSQLT